MESIISAEFPEAAVHTLLVVALLTSGEMRKLLKGFGTVAGFGELPGAGPVAGSRRFLVQFEQRVVTNAFLTAWRRHREGVHCKVQKPAPEIEERQKEWTQTLNTLQRLLQECNLQTGPMTLSPATGGRPSRNPQQKGLLNKENERRVEVDIEQERAKTDALIAKEFWIYGKIEYIFRLAHSVILCFRDSAAAQRALQAEANTAHNARTPAPQVWKSRDPPQGWSCSNCNQEISGQPASRRSHERLCPEQEEYFQRQKKYGKVPRNTTQSARRARSQSRRRTRVVTFERGTTSPLPRGRQQNRSCSRDRRDREPQQRNQRPILAPVLPSLMALQPLLPPTAFTRYTGTIPKQPSTRQHQESRRK